MRRATWIFAVLLSVLGPLAFAYFVWPTPWKEVFTIRMGDSCRTNTFTMHRNWITGEERFGATSEPSCISLYPAGR